MFKPQDPYSYTYYETLSDGTNSVGLLSVECTVQLYNDLEVQTVSSVQQTPYQQFIVTCTQRFLIKNITNDSLNPKLISEASNATYNNYPALISASMALDFGTDTDILVNLLDYSPQTVNTAVQQSLSNSSDSGISNTSTSSTGNSYSQSSSYGTSVSVSGGAMWGVSASKTADRSNTLTSDSSQSNGTQNSNSSQASNSDSMSIKDWGSYATIDPDTSCATWVFGQEYPWNAIECQFETTSNSVKSMILPVAMQSQLCDGTFVYPPSELSNFGLNFVTKSQWRIYVPYTSSTEIGIELDMNYYLATHKGFNTAAGIGVQVIMDSSATTLGVNGANGFAPGNFQIDLNVLGLDPLGVNSDTAIVGFLPNKFIPPVTPASPSSTAALPASFKIISSTNDLMLLNTGANSNFGASQTSLTATWASNVTANSQITLYFKILDLVNEYSLYMKHWKTSDTGIKLTFIFNGNTTNPVVKYVDGFEGEGGEDNLLKISLRNLDFSSIEYHDYLQLGLNSVQIGIEPMDINGCGYQVRALSVRKE